MRNRRLDPDKDATPDTSRDSSPVSLGPMRSYLGFALRRAQLETFSKATLLLSSLRLTPGQFSVLTVIHSNDAPSQTTVCNALGIQKANFAPLIRHLEKRKLISRSAAAVDRRAQLLQLTVLGRSVLRRARRLHDRYEAQLIAALGGALRHRELIEQLYGIAGLAPAGEPATLQGERRRIAPVPRKSGTPRRLPKRARVRRAPGLPERGLQLSGQ